MYKVKINETEEIDVAISEHQIAINEEDTTWDICVLPDGRLHVLMGSQSFNAFPIAVDKQKKELTIRVNRQVFQLKIQEPIDLLLQKMGLNMNLVKKAETIKAPMPGLVLQIMAKEGQILKKGDPVLILEAMKMENIFKSPEDAMVKSIKIKPGQAVEKGAILIELA